MQRFWPDWRTRTSLARRTLLVYVLSVLMTASLGAVLTYHFLQRDLEKDGRAKLLEAARLYGLAVFSRLTRADQALEQLAAASIQGADDVHAQMDRESPLAAVYFVRADAIDVGDELSEKRARSQQLASKVGQALRDDPLRDSTVEVVREDSGIVPVLVREVPGASGLFAVGWLRPDFVWGSWRLPQGMQYCITGAQRSFRICHPREDQTGRASPQYPNPDRLTAQWPLFMRARFGIDEWSAEASQLQSNILTPLTGWRTQAVPLAGTAVLLAVLIGSVLIQRGFRPLENLLASWNASNSDAAGVSARESVELEHLSNFIVRSAAGLERCRGLLEMLTELDRKILVAGSLQTTVLWLLPRLAAEIRARGVAAVLTGAPEHEAGMFYLAAAGNQPGSAPCDISIQGVRGLLEIEGIIDLSKLEVDLLQLRSSGFGAARAYPIRDEKHLVGALLFLDPHDGDLDTERQCLAFSDRLSVAVSHWRRKEDLARAMHFDSHTGLANRELLLERLGRALAASTAGRTLALMFIGLDGVENINATLGRRAGDQLLRLAASRIRSVIRETETLARVTGNELVLMVPELDEPASAAMAAERIISLFEKPFLADGLSYSVSASVGIAVAPADGMTPEGLIRSAETAMRRAKGGSARRIAFFEEVMNEHANRRIWLEHGLRSAIGTPELQVHFQPKVDIASGEVIAAEALLRWMHPREGLIQPVEFIPTAEASGLILPIGQWVLEEACRRLLEWRRLGVKLDHIAVNISLRQLQDDAFLEYLFQYLSAGGIDGHSLELEITESMWAEQPAQLSGALERLRKRGVRVAIDDFGTGYSSLALLQLLPVDVLKIDRAFVNEIESGTGDAIVKAIIALGLALGKDLVAEGVETEAQARALVQRGCPSAQGFYYAPALPAEEFVRFYRQRQSLLEREKPRALQA